ncbi:unnamed protein product [Aphanomyces euteiches]
MATSSPSLAKVAHDADWDILRSRFVHRDIADAYKSVWEGKSALHWTAFHGELPIMEMLAPLVDINQTDSTGQTALHIAAAANKLPIVKLLLERGADKDIPDANGMTALHLAATNNNEAIVSLLIQRRARADLLDKRGRTALDVATGTSKGWIEKANEQNADYYIKLESKPIEDVDDDNEPPHLSFIRHGHFKKLQEWLDANPESIDRLDIEGKTALIHAVLAKKEKLVKLILQYGPNVDATDHTGKTALMYAVDAGDHSIVSMLLEQFADIDIEDYEGNTALMLASDVINNNTDMDVASWVVCKSLLKKENVYRSTSTEYRHRFQASVEHHIRKNATFNTSLFRRAINLHPELGALFLDECLVVERHTISFHNLDAIYGSDVIQSTLYHALHPQNAAMQVRINKSVLSHLVMRRILELKWELFGQRIYLEQLFMYLLLATSMTISTMTIYGTSDHGKTEGLGQLLLVNWILVLAAAVSGCIMIQFLRPAWLWSCARFCFDRRWTAYDPTVVITDLEDCKAIAKRWLLLFALCLTALLSLALYTILDKIHIRDAVHSPFFILNMLVLFATTLYFLYLEMNEFIGGAGSVRQGFRSLCGPQRARDRKQIVRGFKNYFGSLVNIWQLSIYVLIIVLYIPCSISYMNHHSPVVYTIVLSVGTLVTLSLWLLLVQFLEIHPTAGFLLPMLPSLLIDVGNFALLYAAVQWGFSVTFYVLQSKDNDTFWSVFTKTYFVLFGDNLGFNDKDDDDPTALESYRSLLTMIHAAVVVVLLLNLLIALMNTTLGQGLERAKTEALASYAQCILRMEMSLRNESTMKLGAALNPAFRETRNKAEFAKTDEDEEIIRSLEESSKEWHVGMEMLRRHTHNHMAQLGQRLNNGPIEGIPDALEKREREIRDRFAQATAANPPTKLNVETRFLEVKQHVLHTLDKLVKIDRVPSELVDATKQAIVAEFEQQVQKSRDELNDPDVLSSEDMWKATLQQWSRQDKQMKAMRQEMRELRAQLAKVLQQSPPPTFRPSHDVEHLEGFIV